jgi:hypothetical protein
MALDSRAAEAIIAAGGGQPLPRPIIVLEQTGLTMHRRLVCLSTLVAVAAVFAVSACGGDDASSDDKASGGGAAEVSSGGAEAPSGGGGDGGDKPGACAELRQTIEDVSTKGLEQVADPAALASTYSEGAASVRASAEQSGDDGVEAAANKVAAALESLGEQVASGSTQIPDTNELTQAGIELQQACA